MFGKLEYLTISILLFQGSDPGKFLLDKGENLSMVALLGFLVYILHRQNERREEQIRLLYEARIKELEERVDFLQSKLPQSL